MNFKKPRVAGKTLMFALLSVMAQTAWAGKGDMGDGFMAKDAKKSLIVYWERDIDVLNTIAPDWDQLDERLVEYVENSSSESKKSEIKVGYKFAYSSRFFYLMIVAHTDKTASRDRGYQNGDGFHFLFALPKADKKQKSISNEFYVLGFWNGGADAGKILARKRVWYHNRDLSSAMLKKTSFSIQKPGNAVIYQAAISWDDIPPFKPYFMDESGINFCFVQAVENADENYYFLLRDDRIQSEQSDRKYAAYQLEKKTNTQKTDILQGLTNHFVYGKKTASLCFAVNTHDAIQSEIEIKTPLKSKQVKLVAHKGITVKKWTIESNWLQNGMNHVVVSVGKSSENASGYEIFKMSEGIIPDYSNTLAEYKKNPAYSRHDINSLEFLLRDFKDAVKSFKGYSSPKIIGEKHRLVSGLFDELKNGKSILQTGNGVVVRRAFRSGIDNSLQPYSLRFPREYRPDGKHSLIVFLHGSGVDDRWLNSADLNVYRMADEFNAFILTPKGRGVSDYYTNNHANSDIMEALHDVSGVFPINRNKIVLAGFSMGGYGVYRIGYEFPLHFSGFLVLSGIPGVSNRIGEGHPDFLQEKYLKKLPNKPFFILHSKEDRNCPYWDTLAFVEKLKMQNLDVLFLIDKSRGHSIAGDEQVRQIVDWLREKSLL